MNISDKKLIVFEKDIDEDEIPGEKRFVKFLDDNKKYAIFYMPLIAPKNFMSYLKENNIEIAYEIKDEQRLSEYEDIVHTFVNESGVYEVYKGIELRKKMVLLVDKGMDICLNLPAFSYTIDDNYIYITPIKNNDATKSYCYVYDEDKINPELRKIMIETVEAVPGILRMNDFYKKDSKNLQKIKKK